MSFVNVKSALSGSEKYPISRDPAEEVKPALFQEVSENTAYERPLGKVMDFSLFNHPRRVKFFVINTI
jgi:hypothetical protein